MKRIIIFVLCFLSTPAFSCNKVDPWPATDNATFCHQFIEAAICHCAGTFPEGFCRQRGMKWIYDRMMDKYHSVENACRLNPGEVDEPTCNAQWAYFLQHCSM